MKLPAELFVKCTFKGALPLVVLAVKMAAKKGVYVPIAEAGCPFEMFAVWLGGAVQPCTPLKATVCDPTLRLGTVVPLACHASAIDTPHRAGGHRTSRADRDCQGAALLHVDVGRPLVHIGANRSIHAPIRAVLPSALSDTEAPNASS